MFMWINSLTIELFYVNIVTNNYYKTFNLCYIEKYLIIINVNPNL